MVRKYNSTEEIKCFRSIVRRFNTFGSNRRHSEPISRTDLVAQESEWTELLIDLLGFGNTYVLSNFRYSLLIEFDE